MATATKKSLKKWLGCFKLYRRLFHLVQFVKCWQIFRELNSKRLYRRLEKEKESRCLVFKISTKGEISAFSRRSRAVTDTKCTKKRDTRAKLFFCQSIPVGFLLNLLPSPSSLLKLNNINRRLWEDWGWVRGGKVPSGEERGDTAAFSGQPPPEPLYNRYYCMLSAGH